MTTPDLVERLRGLVERLEKLEGPSVYLDEAIWEAVGGWPERKFRSFNYMKVFGTPVTGSLDAAVALVERVLPGWEWQVGDDAHFGKYGAVYQSRSEGGAGLSEDDMVAASTPAIALLIAALRALSQETSK